MTICDHFQHPTWLRIVFVINLMPDTYERNCIRKLVVKTDYGLKILKKLLII